MRTADEAAGMAEQEAAGMAAHEMAAKAAHKTMLRRESDAAAVAFDCL
jgi:hypothetical protein